MKLNGKKTWILSILLGHSSASNIQMVWLRNSKPGSAFEEISSWKGLISLRPMPLWCNGPQFTSCLSLKSYLVWNHCRVIYLCFFCTRILRRTKMYNMLTCQWDLLSMERMGRRCALNSKRHFMGCIRVLELGGSTSLQNSRTVNWNNQSLTHACSLDWM